VETADQNGLRRAVRVSAVGYEGSRPAIAPIVAFDIETTPRERRDRNVALGAPICDRSSLVELR